MPYTAALAAHTRDFSRSQLWVARVIHEISHPAPAAGYTPPWAATSPPLSRDEYLELAAEGSLLSAACLTLSSIEIAQLGDGVVTRRGSSQRELSRPIRQNR